MYEIIEPNHHIILSSHQVTMLAVLIIWSIIWKGFALWRAGRNKQLGWFVALLVLNTLGILEILYLLFCQPKPKPHKHEQE